MSEKEELPELPEPVTFGIALSLNPNPMAGMAQVPPSGFTIYQIRAYGLECYRAGMEKAREAPK